VVGIVFAAALVAGSAAQAARDPADINEGELRFLVEPPAEPVHVHDSQVTVTADSLESGWVRSRQCHYRLDQVAALEVVFNPGRVRGLRIERAENIGRARVVGASVQLENVGRNAVLCLANETHALTRLPDGSYEWRGGPYMRRFLDGYFPMQVKLALEYPPARLRLQSLEPPELRLKAVQQSGQLRLESFFEGRLIIAVRFAPLATPAP
jgi:hypothetical protein